MTESKPTLDDVLTAYGRALVGKLGLRTFNSSWGVDGVFRSNILEHQDIEERYLRRLAAERSATDEAIRSDKR